MNDKEKTNGDFLEKYRYRDDVKRSLECNKKTILAKKG